MKYYAVYANIVRSFKHLRKIMDRDSFKAKTSSTVTVAKLVKLRFDRYINFIPFALHSIVVKLKTELWALYIMEFEIYILKVPPHQFIVTAAQHCMNE